MKYLIAAVLIGLLFASCNRGGPSFQAPDQSDVSEIKVYDTGEPSPIPREAILPPADYAAVLDLLNGAEFDNDPMKWMIMGDLQITTSKGMVQIALYRTMQGRGAFKCDGEYYRGGTDAGFDRLVDVARNNPSEQNAAGQPATRPLSK